MINDTLAISAVPFALIVNGFIVPVIMVELTKAICDLARGVPISAHNALRVSNCIVTHEILGWSLRSPLPCVSDSTIQADEPEDHCNGLAQ